ncbi:MAG: hypothetical protein ACRDQ0_08860, partial [Pseudonocardia sp.]
MSNGAQTTPRAGGRARHRAWIGGAVFTGGFVANGVFPDALADRPLPLPNAPTAAVLDYFATQGAASTASGICILVMTVGLAVFARAVGALAPPDPLRTAAGAVAIAALAVSGLLSLLLAVLGPSGADAAVLLTRSTNFYTGGVIHVVALGVYVATL